MPTYIGSNAPPSSFRNGGACSACNRADRLVDIGVFIDYEGWVLLCAPCLADAAMCIKGMDLQGAHEPLAADVPSILPPPDFPETEPLEEEPEYPIIVPVDPDDTEEEENPRIPGVPVKAKRPAPKAIVAGSKKRPVKNKSRKRVRNQAFPQPYSLEPLPAATEALLHAMEA